VLGSQIPRGHIVGQSRRELPGPAETVNKMFAVFKDRGEDDYIGEAVSQLEHALQCAYQAVQHVSNLPEDLPFDPRRIIVSALFHDVGHLLRVENFDSKMLDTLSNCSLGVVGHETIGAVYLRNMGFPWPIPELVEGHVQAKRYLTCKYPEYYGRLSEASKGTLKLQGGPMSLAEASLFEDDPLCKLKLRLREWDECAKVTNRIYEPVEILQCIKTKTFSPLVLPNLESYRSIILGVLESSK